MKINPFSRRGSVKGSRLKLSSLRLVSRQGDRKMPAFSRLGYARASCLIGVGLFFAGVVFLPGWWKLLGAVMAFQFAAPAIGEWIKSRNGTDGL